MAFVKKIADKAKATSDGIAASGLALQVLSPAVQAKVIRPDQHAKAGKIVNRMSEAGYSKAQINDVVGALVATRDEDMKAAFELFAGADGVIDTEEMKTVVPLIGENLDEEGIRCLFRQADKDCSGKIEFCEFTQMMYALTPKAKPSGGLLDCQMELTQAQEGLEEAMKNVDKDPCNRDYVVNLGVWFGALIAAEVAVEELKAKQNPEKVSAGSLLKKGGEGFAKMGQSAESAKVLKPEIQLRIIRPQDYQRAGRIIQRMKKYDRIEFSKDDINNVLMSLVAFDNDEMIPAFNLWAGEDGVIDATELKMVVPLLGEDLTEEEIDCMFEAADTDQSGFIDLQEFQAMMARMQMKGDGQDRYQLVGMARASAYAQAAAART